MFTGLIEEIGMVRRIIPGRHSAKIELSARTVLEGTKIGDSIAVNGACLTVVDLDREGFSADAAHETLKRTNLGSLKSGTAVNLERALRFGDRLGGHLVSGHVDGTAVLQAVRPDGIARLYGFDCPRELFPLIAEKGSVAIDGISLTVAELSETGFSVSVIPHTAASTTLDRRKPGDRVNLECDQVAKYLARLSRFMEARPDTPHGSRKDAITELKQDTLARYGFA